MQSEAVNAWRNAKGRGILEMFTGTGKTRVGINIIKACYAKNKDFKTLILAPTNFIKDQWIDQVSGLDCGKNVDVKTFAAGTKLNGVKYDLFISDECHNMCGAEYINIIYRVEFRFFLGLTATLKRLDGRESNLLKHFDVVYTVNKDDAMKNGWCSDFVHYKVLISPDDIHEYDIIMNTYNHAFEYFDKNWDIVQRVLKSAPRDPWLLSIVKQTGRCVKELKGKAALTINTINKRKTWLYTHPEKLVVTRQIIEKRLDKKIITFSQSKQFAQSIGIGEFIDSSKSTKKQAKIIAAFNDSPNGVINSVKSMEAGADIKGLSVGISTSINSSMVSSVQKSGRICRYEEGKKAEFFTIVMKDTIEEHWFNKAMDGQDYIAINIKGLDCVLDGKKFRAIREHGLYDEEY